MENQELTKKWDALTDQQKASFGDRFITHETNLSAWAKPFADLSELKKKRVLSEIAQIEAKELNGVIGFGI